jgi:hypothetical protein
LKTIQTLIGLVMQRSSLKPGCGGPLLGQAPLLQALEMRRMLQQSPHGPFQTSAKVLAEWSRREEEVDIAVPKDWKRMLRYIISKVSISLTATFNKVGAKQGMLALGSECS